MENGSKPASQDDLQGVKRELKEDFLRLDQKVDSVADRLDQKLDSVKTELKSDIARVAKAVVAIQADVRQIKESIPAKADWQRVFKNLDLCAARRPIRIKTLEAKS